MTLTSPLTRIVLAAAVCLLCTSTALGIDTIDLGSSPPDPVLSWDHPGSGFSVIGDFNGDGQRDYAVGVNENDVNSVLVAFGPAAGERAEDLVAQGQGLVITDTDTGRNQMGRTIANVGDVNGDGRDDLFVSTTAFTSTSDSFIVYGRGAGALDLASFSASDGIRIRHTNPNNPIYMGAASAGDANGDGRGDLAFSSFSSEPKGNLSGSAWVVFGQATWPAVIDLDALGIGGYRIDGSRQSAELGWAIAGAGDVNGDGRGDIAVSAPRARGSNLGSVYVIYGKASATAIDTASLGTAGMRIDGPGRIGGDDPDSLEGLGDLNGDGRDDIALTCVSCGLGAVVLGSSSNATVDLAQLGSRGWTISGGYQALSRPHRLGDVNGDGRADVGFSSPDWNDAPAPGSYLVVTNAEFGGSYDLYDGSLDGRAFMIRGAATYQYVGLNAFGVPDVTGDGVRDILLDLTDSGGTGEPGKLVTISGAGLAMAEDEDTEPPTITASVSPAPNAAGWNKTSVTVSFTCDDDTQIASCSSPVTLSDEGTGQVVSGTAQDAAGNSASTSVTVKIDRTLPQITFSGAHATYNPDQQVAITCVASDALSGIASASCPSLTVRADTLAVGANTLTATATDVAGNTRTQTLSFQLVVTNASLQRLVDLYLPPTNLTDILLATTLKLNLALGQKQAFILLVSTQSGNRLTVQEANNLIRFAQAL